MFKVRVNDTWLDLLADSGSSINLLDCKSFNKLKPRPTLKPTNAKIYPYKSDVNVKPSNISVGDTVVVKRDPSTKKSLSP